jgi:hypothetical protein
MEERLVDAMESAYNRKEGMHQKDLLKLLQQHYRLVRQALGILLAKSERLKRRVAVLEAKMEDCHFSLRHAFDTELQDEEVSQLKITAEKCARQIEEANKQRAAYEARAAEISGDDFERTLELLEHKLANPVIELEGNLEADDRLWIQDWIAHLKKQEKWGKMMLNSPSQGRESAAAAAVKRADAAAAPGVDMP